MNSMKNQHLGKNMRISFSDKNLISLYRSGNFIGSKMSDIEKKSDIFFIADTHFGDERILRYENRPFASVEEMDAQIVRNWNERVKDDDTVYLLGDVGNESFIKNLSGRKFLVKGNHDTQSNEHYRRVGFLEVYDMPVIFEGFWILSHEPLYVCKNMPYANIFGHVHANPIYKDFSEQSFCASVERIGYVPVSFVEIKRKIAGK